jgi:hypothetical protein
MSTKSREVIFGSQVSAAMNAEQPANVPTRPTPEAHAWSLRMDGGPAQPSPTIAQCLNDG